MEISEIERICIAVNATGTMVYLRWFTMAYLGS